MIWHILELVASLALILGSSILFTNGIEHIGLRLNLHQGAVGSILAAVGTALPETIIPVLAILVFASPGSNDIGIGAILGAPFMLSTLGFFVTGASVCFFSRRGKRPPQMRFCADTLKRDLSYFLLFFGVAIAAGMVHDTPWLNYGAAAFVVLGYGWYVRSTMKADGHDMEECAALFATKYFGLRGRLRFMLAQITLGLALMILGAHMFVGGVEAVAHAAGVPALVLSLIITPVATELPEKLNSVLWVREGKDILAMGNMTGAMVFQSAFPVAFGLLFTHWNLDLLSLLSAGLALLAGAAVLVSLRLSGRLIPGILQLGGLLYLIYLTCVFIVPHK